MPEQFQNPDRTVLRIAGTDRLSFLEGLVTNSVLRLDEAPVYAAMLGPQGKYLFDFILARDGESVLLDIKTDRAKTLAARLNMYKLRADVTITDAGLHVVQGFADMPDGAFADPRHHNLGWRMYSDTDMATKLPIDIWDALRVDNLVPETGIELIPDETYILEAGFERLHGVDFRKGCYVGQEVTARMKHKTALKKGLVAVSVEGVAPVATPIIADGKAAGMLFSTAHGKGIAYLRFDRASADMKAGGAVVQLL